MAVDGFGSLGVERLELGEEFWRGVVGESGAESGVGWDAGEGLLGEEGLRRDEPRDAGADDDDVVFLERGEKRRER